MKIQHKHLDISLSYIYPTIHEYESNKDILPGQYKVIISTPEKHLCNLVNIPINDSRVYFGRRGNRHAISPLINISDLDESEINYTNNITVVLKKNKNSRIDILTVYWGDGKAPKEPQPNTPTFIEDLDFWMMHCLIPDEKINIKVGIPWFYKYLLDK